MHVFAYFNVGKNNIISLKIELNMFISEYKI